MDEPEGNETKQIGRGFGLDGISAIEASGIFSAVDFTPRDGSLAQDPTSPYSIPGVVIVEVHEPRRR